MIGERFAGRSEVEKISSSIGMDSSARKARRQTALDVDTVILPS
jgi:hypothetical protein